MDGSERSDGGGWSDVEQRFFETAPPDVPLQPPAPPSFDDLAPPLPERRRARLAAKTRRARQGGPPRVKWTALRRAWARALASGLVLAAQGWRRFARALAAGLVRVAWGWRRFSAITAETWRRLAPVRRVARHSAAAGLRNAFERLLDGLPSERPDGRTILAGVAAVAVVLCLSATVLAHAILRPF